MNLKEPLKVAHLIHTLGMAGAEKHLLYLLPALKPYGIECELICVTKKNSLDQVKFFLRNLEDAGVKTSLFSYKTKFQFLAISRKIAFNLRRNNTWVLHSHLFNADFISSLIKIFFFKRLITISTKHGYNEKYLADVDLSEPLRHQTIYRYVSEWMFSKTNYNIGVSKALSNLYYELGISKKRMKYIHHGIEIPEKKEAKHEMEGSPRILSVGRLMKFKGYTYLLKALPQVIKKFPKLKLIILGEGPEKEKLASEADRLGVAHHIKFEGHDSPSAFAEQCDVMVIPSLFEAFGLVYIEAFAMKIPLIAFDGGASEEIIDHLENGILVHRKNSGELAEKIIYLLEDPEERERLAAAGFLKFQNHFTVERMVKETAEFYFSIARANSI